MTVSASAKRDIIFISKGTPEDDEFVLWLAPRLEAHGYKVFADILSLDPGDRWRKEITDTLQNRAIKMLLCCSNPTLAKTGVQEELGIASDLAKQLKDPKFIIPLRLEPFKKLFGMGELQYLNFENRWAAALIELTNSLAKQEVPRHDPQISSGWANYRRRNEVQLELAPERLTSNWLRIGFAPDYIRYFCPTGSVDHGAMQQACRDFVHPVETHLRGIFSFCTLDEINEGFARIGKFSIAAEIPLLEFCENGMQDPFIKSREASNYVVSILRKSWESYCRQRGLLDYFYSQSPGFHVTEKQIPLGKKIPWGHQGEKRSSMLRNKAQGKIWQFGVSAFPNLWPFPHFRLKARVLFADTADDRVGEIFEDKKLQHRFRRRICKGWRNKQWHGRLMAFLELLSGEDSMIRLPVAANEFIKLDAAPMLFTSPVTTVLPDILSDEDEDLDCDLSDSSLPLEDGDE